MSKTITYTQCLLSQGDIQQTAWIPSIYAFEDRFIKIDNEGTWKVKGVYGGIILPADQIDVNREAIKHMEIVTRR